MNKFFNKFSIVGLVALALSSCGGGGGSGTSNSSSDSYGFSGKAVKGAIGGGTVICFDTTGTEVERATTSSDGDFKLKKPCPSTGKLVVRGGIDKSTGEFIEELSAPGDSKYITPLTTMQQAILDDDIAISNTDSRNFILKSKNINPLEDSNTDSKKLVKTSLVLHSMAKNLQQQSADDLSYLEAIKIITTELKDDRIDYFGSDDNTAKQSATGYVDKILSSNNGSLAKKLKVDVPSKNIDSLKEMIKKTGKELQTKDKKKNGLVEDKNDTIIPPTLRDKLPRGYVRITAEEIEGANYKLKFAVNEKFKNFKNITNLTYECKIFDKVVGNYINYRDLSAWQSGTLNNCKLGEFFKFSKTLNTDKLLIIKYSNSNGVNYSAPHKIGSYTDGAVTTITFDSKVYLPISDSWNEKDITSDLKNGNAITGLKVDSKGYTTKLGYLPVGFFYKPTTVPATTFKNVVAGVKFSIGKNKAEVILMVDKLYIKRDSFKNGTAKNPYLDNILSTSNSDFSWRKSNYYHKLGLFPLQNFKTVPNYKGNTISRADFNKYGLLRFEKPSDANDDLSLSAQAGLGNKSNLIGISLTNICGKIVIISKATVCDYIRSMINAEDAEQVEITPFVRSNLKYSQSNILKTDQAEITVAGKQYATFPTITIKGKPDTSRLKIKGKTGLQGIDSDGDGLSDYWEMRLGRNPFDASDRNNDTDGDGIDDKTEVALGMNPSDSKDKVVVELDKTTIKITKGGSADKFKVTIKGGVSDLDKKIKFTLIGNAHNAISLDKVTDTYITTSGTETVVVTPKGGDNFNNVSSPKIVMTVKIGTGSNSIQLPTKQIAITSDDFIWSYLGKKWDKPVNLFVAGDSAYFYKKGTYNLGYSNDCRGFAVKYKNSSNSNLYKSSATPAGGSATYSDFGDSYNGYQPYLKINDMDFDKPFSMVVRCKKNEVENGQNGKTGSMPYSSAMYWKNYVLQVPSVATLTSPMALVGVGLQFDLSTLIANNTGNQSVQYSENTDPNNIGSLSGSIVTISSSALSDQTATYTFTFAETLRYKAKTRDVKVVVRPTHPKPSTEPTVSSPVVEWGTAVTITLVNNQDYRIMAEGGTTIAPNHITITGNKINASAPGKVKLQTRTKVGAGKAASAWTDGRLITFTKKTPKGFLYVWGKATGTVNAANNSYKYYSYVHYRNSHNQDINLTVNPASVTIEERNIAPWDYIDDGTRADIVYGFKIKQYPHKRFYVRRGITADVTLTFVENKLYKSKSFTVTLISEKDEQSTPSESVVNNATVEWNIPVTIATVTNQEYRIVAEDGTSSAPNHITYNPNLATISASSPGKVRVQTRKVETVAKKSSPWTAGLLVTFTKMSTPTVPQTALNVEPNQTLDLSSLITSDTAEQTIQYAEKTDSNNIGSLSGSKVTISSSAVIGQTAVYSIEFSGDSIKYTSGVIDVTLTVKTTQSVPNTEATLSNSTVEWGTPVTFTKVTGQDYRIVSADGSLTVPSHITYEASTSSINATAPGIVKLQTRKSETPRAKPSVWSAGTTVTFSKKQSMAAISLVAAPPENTTYYRFYGNKNRGITYSNPNNQAVSLIVKSPATAKQVTSSPWNYINRVGREDIVYSFDSNGRDKVIIYIKKGITTQATVTFAANDKYQQKSYLVDLSAAKESQTTPTEATTNRPTAEWITPITVLRQNNQEYKIIGIGGSSVAPPSHITYDLNTGTINATRPGKVKIQTRKAETITEKPSAWTAGATVTFTIMSVPNVSKTTINVEKNGKFDLSKLIASSTFGQTVEYEEKTDSNSIGLLSGSIVTVDSSATNGQSAVYSIKFIGDNLKYTAGVTDITLTVKTTQGAPSTEATINNPTVEWGTPVTFDKVRTQDYRIVLADGSVAPSHIIYEASTSSIKATAPGIVKLQTRNSETATQKPSAWSAGKIVTFIRQDSPASISFASVSPGNKTYYRYYGNGNGINYSNPNKQAVSLTVASPATAIEKNVSPWNYIKRTDKEDVVYGFTTDGNPPVLVYVKKGVTTQATITFIKDDKYNEKSYSVNLSAVKDNQTLPFEVTVDKTNVEWITPVLVVEKESEQDYRIVATDGTSTPPAHITYDDKTFKIIATAPGKVKLQTRKKEAINKKPSAWTAGATVTFGKQIINVHKTANIRAGDSINLYTLLWSKATIDNNLKGSVVYSEVTDSSSIGSLSASGGTVTISSSASNGQSAVYKVKFAGNSSIKTFDANITFTVRNVVPTEPTIYPITTSSFRIKTKYVPKYTVTIKNISALSLPNHTIKYKWQKRTSATASWTDITGATTNSYQIPSNFTLGHRIRVGYAYTKSGIDSRYIWSDEITVVIFEPLLSSKSIYSNNSETMVKLQTFTKPGDPIRLYLVWLHKSQNDKGSYVKIFYPHDGGYKIYTSQNLNKGNIHSELRSKYVYKGYGDRPNGGHYSPDYFQYRIYNRKDKVIYYSDKVKPGDYD